MSHRLLVILVLTVAVLNFATRNLPWHLDNYDQAKQAFTSYEMVTQGHWWLQHTPQQHIATKPPLVGWISAGLYQFTGQWDLSWRLPTFLATLTILYLLLREGARRFTEPVGWLAAAVFSLNLITPRIATLVRTDMILTLAIFLSGWLIWRRVLAGTGWGLRERGLLCLFLLVGVWTKGPIIYAFLIPGLLAYRFLARPTWQHAWSGWWPWVLPLLTFMGWVWVNFMNSQEFYEDVILKEFLGRFTVGEQAVHRAQPPYYYVLHLLTRFAPWSLCLIVLLSFRSLRDWLRTQPGAVWLVCWILGALLIMSAVPSKRIDRIFPIIPPIALLIATLGSRAITTMQGWKGVSARGWLQIGTGVAALVTTGYTVANVVDQYRHDRATLTKYCHEIRDKAQREHLKVALTSTEPHEGMLMYLGLPQFTPLDDAFPALMAGELDLLVVRRKNLLTRPDHHLARSILEVRSTSNPKDVYLCLVRQGPPVKVRANPRLPAEAALPSSPEDKP